MTDTDLSVRLKLLDSVCDEFEQQWQLGNQPSLDQYIQRFGEDQREQAFRDLMALELEYRVDLGQQADSANYESRFPEYADIARELVRQINSNLDTHPKANTVDGLPKPGSHAAPVLLKDYEILEEIGRGGMGVVYKAHQVTLERTVAVKVVLGGELAQQNQVDRFLSEAKAAARLQHPGIVAIHEVGETDGQYFFSMEYVAGRTLSDILLDGDVSQRDAVRYIRDVAEAIHYAHDQGVLHRDIKPSNIMIDRASRVRVMDFGLAKRVECDADLTASGQILGTPSYMSPEQARGEISKIDRRSDIFSLGSVLYCLLTGKPPFQADSLAETMAQVVRDEPVAPSRLDVDVDRELERICLRCLEKDPEARFASAKELAGELENFLLAQTSPSNSAPRSRRWIGIAAVSASVLLLFAAAVIVIKIGKNRVTVKTDGNAEVIVGKDRVTVRTGKSGQSATTDADRAAAEWVLGEGGTINTTIGEITDIGQLPKQPFRIIRVSMPKRVTDDDLEHLSNLKDLRNLQLNNTRVHGPGLKYLKGLKLSLLNLNGTPIRDDELKHLAGMKMDTLSFGATRIGDDGLQHLKGLWNLVSLNLSGTLVTDAGLEHLKGLKNLHTINLGGTRVGDAGLEHIKGLPKLAYIDLENTRVSDASLELLKGLQLREIQLDGTQVTPKGMAALKKAFPKLKKFGSSDSTFDQRQREEANP